MPTPMMRDCDERRRATADQRLIRRVVECGPRYPSTLRSERVRGQGVQEWSLAFRELEEERALGHNLITAA